MSDCPKMDRAFQIMESAEELCRYGGDPKYDEFAYALIYLAQLNENIANGCSLDLIREEAAKAKAEIDKIVKLAEADD